MRKKAKKKASAAKVKKSESKAVEKQEIAVTAAETAKPDPAPAPVDEASVEAPAAQAAAPVEKVKPAAEKKPTKAKKAAAKPADEKQADTPTKRKAGRPAKSVEEKAVPTVRKAKGEDAATVIYVQYQGAEESVAELTERVKAAFKAEHKRTAIEQVNIYIKPEERAAYYVVNEKFAGKVDF